MSDVIDHLGVDIASILSCSLFTRSLRAGTHLGPDGTRLGMLKPGFKRL